MDDNVSAEQAASGSPEGNTEKPKRRNWVRLTTWGIVLLILLTLLGGGIVVEFVIHIVFGWIFFLVRVLPRMELEVALLLQGVILICAFGLAAHYVCVGFYSKGSGETDRRWAKRWSVIGVLAVLLLFVAGIGTIGIAHQTVWFWFGQEPMVDYEYTRLIRRTLDKSVDLRTQVATYYHRQGQFPSTTDIPLGTIEANRTESHRHTPALEDNGIINIPIISGWYPRLKGKSIRLIPTAISRITGERSSLRIEWRCTLDDRVVARYLPKDCR